MEREDDQWQEEGGGRQSTDGGPTGVDPEDAEAGAGEGGDTDSDD